MVVCILVQGPNGRMSAQEGSEWSHVCSGRLLMAVYMLAKGLNGRMYAREGS